MLANNKGVALMEAMLAAMVFSLVAVSLVGSIQQMGRLADRTRTESDVMRQLQARIEEQVRNPFIQAFHRKSKPDETGVSYEISVQPVEIQNSEGVRLSQMFRIYARASWKSGQVTQTREAETLRYAMLYR